MDIPMRKKNNKFRRLPIHRWPSASQAGNWGPLARWESHHWGRCKKEMNGRPMVHNVHEDYKHWYRLTSIFKYLDPSWILYNVIKCWGLSNSRSILSTWTWNVYYCTLIVSTISLTFHKKNGGHLQQKVNNLAGAFLQRVLRFQIALDCNLFFCPLMCLVTLRSNRFPKKQYKDHYLNKHWTNCHIMRCHENYIIRNRGGIFL